MDLQPSSVCSEQTIYPSCEHPTDSVKTRPGDLTHVEDKGSNGIFHYSGGGLGAPPICPPGSNFKGLLEAVKIGGYEIYWIWGRFLALCHCLNCHPLPLTKG